jgi:pyridoxal phosphate enzyme (YggS family)
MTIALRYVQLRAAVPPHVTIVAVSKFQPVEAIAQAIAAGVTDIGENYVQEARQKLCHPEVSKDPELVEGLARVRKHFIGHIQTNKAKAIAATFDMVQSVDREDAAAALAKAADALGKRLAVLLQLNVSPAERFGCPPDDAPRLADRVRSYASLDLQGVMAIGPITRERSEIARAFELAASTFRRVGGTTLSLGMSGDWAEAVAAGSTMIRVGTTIFGPRPARPASKNPIMSSP